MRKVKTLIITEINPPFYHQSKTNQQTTATITAKICLTTIAIILEKFKTR